MSKNQIGGIVLLVVGAILLYMGYQSSQSLGEQIHETFTGRFTDSTMWYFLFGGAAAAAGIGMLALRRRS
jgi:drug/metabolite transporter (DMT)-like permease